MFIGHFGIAFGLKRWAPRASLGELIAATTWADILWTVFLLLGWEHAAVSVGDTKWTPLSLYDYPWSHSLLLLAIWAFVLATFYKTWRNDWAGALAIAFGVISHWILDWITHRADMPLVPYGRKFGLGLWNSIPATLVTEFAIFFAGVALYAWSTRPRDRWGRWGFWIYAALLIALFVGDRFSTPPEDINGIAWTGLIASIVLIGWAWWFDRHRTSGELPLMSELTTRDRNLEEEFE